MEPSDPVNQLHGLLLIVGQRPRHRRQVHRAGVPSSAASCVHNLSAFASWRRGGEPSSDRARPRAVAARRATPPSGRCVAGRRDVSGECKVLGGYDPGCRGALRRLTTVNARATGLVFALASHQGDARSSTPTPAPRHRAPTRSGPRSRITLDDVLELHAVPIVKIAGRTCSLGKCGFSCLAVYADCNGRTCEYETSLIPTSCGSRERARRACRASTSSRCGPRRSSVGQEEGCPTRRSGPREARGGRRVSAGPDTLPRHTRKLGLEPEHWTSALTSALCATGR